MHRVDNPLVSIVVPIYNVEKYINKCISSLIHQTYKNIEIILVDDESPDNAGKICDEWAAKDNRIKVIHKKNGGLSDARNAGIAEATGKYIGFVDGDDWVSINFVEDLIGALNSTQADIAICRFAQVFEDGRVIVNSRLPEKVQQLTRKEFFQKLLEDGEITNHVWRKIYRRDLIKNNLFPMGMNFEDIYVMPEIGKMTNKIVEIPNIDYFYRQNAAGIIKDASKQNILDHFKATVHAQKLISQIEPTLTRYANVWQVIKDLSIIDDLEKSSLSEGDKAELKRLLSQDIKKQKINLQDLAPIGKGKYSIILKKFATSLMSNSTFPEKVMENKTLKDIKHQLGRGKRKIFSLRREQKLKDRVKQLRNKPIFWILSSPQHGNLGDQALKWGEIEFIRKYFPGYNIKLIPLDDLEMVSTIQKFIKKEDVVALHAGGNIGTLYPGIHEKQLQALQTLKDKKVIIFPQTFYFSNDSAGKKEIEHTYSRLKEINKLQIFVRDKQSFNLVKKEMPELNVSLKPDMALALRYENKFERHGAITLLRQDSEKTLTDKENDYILSTLEKEFTQIKASDMHLYYDGLTEEESRVKVRKQLYTLAHAELGVTDRLHGMLFCAITQTPCVVVKSKSYKIQGVYEWIKQNPYIELINNLEDLPAAISKLKLMKNNKFDTANIDKQFNEMATIIKDYKL